MSLTVSVPASAGGVGDVTLAGTQTLSNKTFASGNNGLSNPAGTFRYVWVGGAIVADRNVTMPVLTGADILVFEAHATTLSNKTFSSGNCGISNPAGTFRYILTGAAIVADRIVTMPLLTSGDVVVCEAFAQTLTNKTLTSPVLTTPTMSSPVITGTPQFNGTRTTVTSPVTEVQTSAITQVNCGTVTLADETSVAIDVIVTCRRRTTNSKRGRWKFSAFVSRTGGGVAVLDSLEVGSSFSLTAGTVTCDVSGNDFRVRITPADTDSRNWDAELCVRVGTAA
jgi:hypothetical protein